MADEEVNEKEQAPVEDSEFAFLVKKTPNGYVVSPVSEFPPPPSFDDIYAACAIVQRNIETQQTAGAIAAGMMQSAQAAAGAGRTQGGIVLPN